MEEKLFCDELREKTRREHDESDKLINIKLAIALTDFDTYGKVLADFYFVFQAIEDSLEQQKQYPYIAPLAKYLSQLTRVEKFEEDLRYFVGESWEQIVQPSNAAEKYCARIGFIAEQNPYLLVAYVFCFYIDVYIMQSFFPSYY